MLGGDEQLFDWNPHLFLQGCQVGLWSAPLPRARARAEGGPRTYGWYGMVNMQQSKSNPHKSTTPTPTPQPLTADPK